MIRKLPHFVFLSCLFDLISIVLISPFRAAEFEKQVKLQKKEIAEFLKERDELILLHRNRHAAMKERHWVEEVEMEKLFDSELTSLMQKYSGSGTGDSASATST